MSKSKTVAYFFSGGGGILALPGLMAVEFALSSLFTMSLLPSGAVFLMVVLSTAVLQPNIKQQLKNRPKQNVNNLALMILPCEMKIL